MNDLDCNDGMFVIDSLGHNLGIDLILSVFAVLFAGSKCIRKVDASMQPLASGKPDFKGWQELFKSLLMNSFHPSTFLNFRLSEFQLLDFRNFNFSTFGISTFASHLC